MKIAFLEDNLAFASEMVHALQTANIEVDHFVSGRACLRALTEQRYDMALLDYEVPDMNGPEVLAGLKVRGNCPPVIFLTGRDSEEDVVAVIESGADDYIVKPPNVKVLLARINALHRRTSEQTDATPVAEYGDLKVDFIKRIFEIEGNQVKLTEKELDLALYFFRHIGELLSRAHLTKVIWGSSPDLDTRTIDVHVSHLRSKLKILPQHGWRLVSVYHQGYRLERLE
jgi:two-component system, OmpR family, response regulator RegX3